MSGSLHLGSGNPAWWDGEQVPSRKQALWLAAQAASAAGDVTVPPEVGVARAAQSRAWSAVAALADDLESFAGFGREPLPDVKCGHGQIVFWSGASWLHPLDMTTCDRPPHA